MKYSSPGKVNYVSWKQKCLFVILGSDDGDVASTLLIIQTWCKSLSHFWSIPVTAGLFIYHEKTYNRDKTSGVLTSDDHTSGVLNITGVVFTCFACASLSKSHLANFSIETWFGKCCGTSDVFGGWICRHHTNKFADSIVSSRIVLTRFKMQMIFRVIWD